MLYTNGINPLVKNFRSLTDSIDHRFKIDFLPIVSIHWLKIFFTTIDLINVFAVNRLSVSIQSMFFFTIGAHLCLSLITARKLVWIIKNPDRTYRSTDSSQIVWITWTRRPCGFLTAGRNYMDPMNAGRIRLTWHLQEPVLGAVAVRNWNLGLEWAVKKFWLRIRLPALG